MKQLFLLIFCWLLAASLQAQLVTTPVTDTTKRMIEIKHADRLSVKKTDSTGEVQTGAGHVIFIDNKTKFYCDSIVHNIKKNIIEAFGNVHINDADTVHAYSNYLIYHTDTKLATLKKNVRMTDGKSMLTSESLDYDTQLKIGTYKNGGKIVSDQTVITSREAVYYADLKDVYFKTDVKLKDPEHDLVTDSLLYNTNTRKANFISLTNITDTSGTVISTSEGSYDLNKKTSLLTSRSTIRYKALIITGDQIATDDSAGLFQAKGNAIMIDTVQGVTVIANDIRSDRNNSTFIATQHPLMILKQEDDSIYVTADTLFSGRLQEDTSKRYFQGFHRVRIFSDSLQAVSDSLYYSGADSVFRLFHDPILWANKSQVTGDTIYLYTKNKKPERLYVFENAMMINQASANFFNQVKGKTINAYFTEGYIDSVQAKGSPAESIYYVQDEDSAFVSMNTLDAAMINLYFASRELKRIVAVRDTHGKNFPMTQIPEEKRKLRGFKWLEDRRPKTKSELFEDPQQQPLPKNDYINKL